MSRTLTGWILARQQQDQADGIVLRYWLHHAGGCDCISVGQQESVFFVRCEDQAAIAQSLAGLSGWRLRPLVLKDLQQRPVAGLYSDSLHTHHRAIDLLTQAGIAMMEEDIRPVDRYLMERFIFGGVTAHQLSNGYWRLQPAEQCPNLRLLSIDIETSMQADQIHSIGLYGDQLSLVLMRDASQQSADPAAGVLAFADEKALLQGLMEQVQRYDPDLFIGWNVIGFDFHVLAQRAQAHGIRLRLGRGQQGLQVGRSENGKWYARVEGRLVLDGIDTLKGATYHFPQYSLEYVAQALFGQGKLLSGKKDRGQAIQRLYHQDKAALARYNLQDCKLVWQIFAHTKLLDYLIERTRLTGLAMDKVGGSAAAFDFQYLPRLHRAGFVAPCYASGAAGLDVPGGFVMEPQPGLYQQVLVLDFKSLYPSIIRTFAVDPAGLAAGLADQADPAHLVPGFHGARFDRTAALLPAIIEQLWQARDQAKQQNNQPLSRVIKIIMNAFYGVLGSDVCRFFDQRLSGSITLRGHQILQQTRDEIERQFGHPVIYGDTDSVFVLLGPDYDHAQARERGQQLADYLNTWWRQQIHQRFGLPSYLELEYETHFSHFFMPRMRHSDKGSKKRYAGLQCLSDGSEQLVFRGLENVRSDWTELAKQVQRQLYQAVFHNQPYQAYLQQLVAQLRAGHWDEQLVYRKRLRQPIEAYRRIRPPHVQAALQARQQGVTYQPGDTISYLITVNGPQPHAFCQASIDYEHYLEKQLAPVVDAILVFRNECLAELISQQPDLFPSGH